MYKLLLACGRSYMEGFKQVLEGETAIEVENDFCHYGFIDQYLVFALRGSDDWDDWKDNFSMTFKNDLMAQILSAIEIHPYRFKNIILTGHSRGGFQCQEIARELDALGYKIKMVVTFASPMIRNPKYTPSTYPHYRFVNGRDGVPNTPLFVQRIFSKCKWGHYGDLIHMNKPSWWSSWAKISGTAKYHPIGSYQKAFKKHFGIN